MRPDNKVQIKYRTGALITNMEFYSQDRKAQNISACQFCEQSPEIHYKCINCDLFLCKICSSKIHSRVELANEHKIIPLEECGTDISADLYRRVDIKKIACEIHNSRICVSYCISCEKPVCLECIQTIHRQHVCCDLLETYETKIKIMKEHESFVFLNEQENKLKEQLQQCQENYKSTEEHIRQCEQKMHDMVKNCAEDLIRQMDDILKPFENKLQERLQELHKLQGEMQEYVNTALLSRNAMDIFETCNKLDTIIPSKYNQEKPCVSVKFIPREILSMYFGKIYHISDVEIMKSYDTNLTRIYKILTLQNGETLIGGRMNDIYKMQALHIEKDEAKILNQKQFYLSDMGLLKNGNVIISSMDSDISIYTRDGQIKSYQSFSPLKTLGIHVNKNNEILVGLTESIHFQWKNADKERKVICLNQYKTDPHKSILSKLRWNSNISNVKHVYEYDNDKASLFTWPRRITTFSDRICVLDVTLFKEEYSDFEGRLVTLTNEGNISWTYEGNMHNCFSPKDLAVTPQDTLIVSDSFDSSLHILNYEGQLIIHHKISDLGIDLPRALCMDKDLLCISCQKDGKAVFNVVSIKSS